MSLCEHVGDERDPRTGAWFSPTYGDWCQCRDCKKRRYDSAADADECEAVTTLRNRDSKPLLPTNEP